MDRLGKKIKTQIQLFHDLVEAPKKYYNDFNRKWQVNNNQYSSMNYSLKVDASTREKIRKALSFMERHYERLDAAHELREVMKVESDIAKLYYPTSATAFKPELGFR